MWRRRTAAVLVVALMTGIGWAAGHARAGTAGETILGNFNRDSILDAVVLGAVSPNLCSTIVQFGTAPGVYQPPIAFTYLTPGGTGTPDCPDIGAAVDLNLDGLDDIAVAWSEGAPAGLGYNRLLLTPPTFRPMHTYTSAIDRPTFIGVGVFDATGRPTPYTVGPGGVVNSVLENGGLVPGPIRYCSVDTPTVQLADWTQSGVQGALVTYTNGCADGSSGVVRIRRDGSIVQLEMDPTGRTRWTARAVNANDDRFLDVRTINQTTGGVSYFINTQQPGMFLLVRAPDANTDRVLLTSTKAFTIDVLANDYATRWVTVTITDPPRYGTVQVLSDKRIVYRPDPDHGRTDRFSYQLSEEGRRSTATVSIRFPT